MVAIENFAMDRGFFYGGELGKDKVTGLRASYIFKSNDDLIVIVSIIGKNKLNVRISENSSHLSRLAILFIVDLSEELNKKWPNSVVADAAGVEAP